jgi:hypothetical protein
MSEKMAVEEAGLAVIVPYVQIKSKGPKGGEERETHPRNDRGTRGFCGKSRGFSLWKWGEFPSMEIGV